MKAVVFDFDGTLTKKGQNAWRTLWQFAGYTLDEASEYRTLFKKFMNREIDHQTWCDLTCECLKKSKLSEVAVLNLGAMMEQIDGVHETLLTLKKKGYSLYIVSGSVKQMINTCLKMDNIALFDGIFANRFEYTNDGVLNKIVGTKFDFEGKRVFVEKLMQEKNMSPEDIVFVGNSHNDEFVKACGVKTICLNAEHTNAGNKNAWDLSIRANNLTAILPYLTNATSAELIK